MTTYNKLIRDRIPEIIRDNGGRPITRALRVNEFKNALREKILEEAGEIVAAKNRNLLIEELADLQEVLRALYTTYRITPKEVAAVARKKKKERGGFTRRILLKEVK